MHLLRSEYDHTLGAPGESNYVFYYHLDLDIIDTFLRYIPLDDRIV